MVRGVKAASDREQCILVCNAGVTEEWVQRGDLLACGYKVPPSTRRVLAGHPRTPAGVGPVGVCQTLVQVADPGICWSRMSRGPPSSPGWEPCPERTFRW